MSGRWDVLFKLILIGDTGTGKSCLLHSLVDGRFRRNTSHTVGVEFGSKILHVGEKSVKLQIWDTAGQERFKAVTRSYYRGAAGAIIVYDITSRQSYKNVEGWLQDARDLASHGVVIALVGNKTDLESERKVSFVEASCFAQENDMLYFETSAMDQDSVVEIFSRVAKSIMTRLDDGLIDTRQVVDVESSKNASIRSDRTRIHKRAGFDRSISIRQHSHPPIELFLEEMLWMIQAAA